MFGSVDMAFTYASARSMISSALFVWRSEGALRTPNAMRSANAENEKMVESPERMRMKELAGHAARRNHGNPAGLYHSTSVYIRVDVGLKPSSSLPS